MLVERLTPVGGAVASSSDSTEDMALGLASKTASWNHRSLESIEDSWNVLLAHSNADPLFNSPQWLQSWWRNYQPTIGAEIDIRAVSTGAELTGLAVLHARRAKYRFGIRGTRYELLGTASRVPGVGFSEKTEFILRRGFEAASAAALVEELGGDARWDDLLVSHTPVGSATESAFEQLAAEFKVYLRRLDPSEGWEIPLEGGFEAFLARLGAGTRARVLGSRRRLEEAGSVRERVLGPHELDEGWNVFARLHEARWGRSFSNHWRRFYGDIARQQVARGVPVISVLEFDGEPISALVNFRAGLREYSIASAFVTVDVKRVSPGWMHLGLAIERACADGMEHFDLLGGTGKQEQYKAALGGSRYELVSLQLVRNPALAFMYRAWDFAQRIRGK